MASAALFAGEGALEPVSVCELLAHAAEREGAVVALAGRFSFRENGRYVSEENCPAAQGWPGSIQVAFDDKQAPKAPPVLTVDAAALDRKMKVIRQHTALAKFRFGSPWYDRWAVIYGRVEFRPEFRDGKKPGNVNGPLESAPARLVCREGAVVLLPDE
ncbi:MAG: hypothetical protein ACE15B_10280 [Bryobacteraceae bacterium]